MKDLDILLNEILVDLLITKRHENKDLLIYPTTNKIAEHVNKLDIKLKQHLK